MNVTVPEPTTATTAVRLTVTRNGGAAGTVQVEWNATLNGNLANDDVTPVRGNVRFLSGQVSQEIEIFVKSDDVPEDNEVSMYAVCGDVIDCFSMPYFIS